MRLHEMLKRYDEVFQDELGTMKTIKAELKLKENATPKFLAHYDAKLPIKLAADASAYGIGAVISHVYPDSSERPVAFASRTLTSAEWIYAQLEKEAFALVYGVKHFHQYLYGRMFTLVTHHKPLTTILNPRKGIPSLAAARLQRWAIILSKSNLSALKNTITLMDCPDCLFRM